MNSCVLQAMGPRLKRGQWTEENLKQAVEAVKSKTLSTYAAVERFGVPRRTLRRHVKEGKTLKSKLGRKSILTPVQEQDLCVRIIKLADTGYPLTAKAIRLCVFRYCVSNNTKNTFSLQKGLAGRKWLKGFLARNKHVSKRTAQNLNPARAQKVNRFIVSDYFHKLNDLLLSKNLMGKPESVYNVDEKGCRLSLHKQPSVYAKTGTKRVHIVAKEHGESVSIVSCGNALGSAVPPMILFKGVRMKPEYVDNLPPSSACQMTPRGSMTTKSFVNWIHHFSRFKTPGPCILIFDGAKSHLDYEIVDVAQDYEITLFCLPANTTHELQPMDKSVFRAFEHYWDEAVLLYWSNHGDRTITKQRFGTLFSGVWDKCMTPSNIKSGFRATGIYPFNPNILPDEAYAPSTVTEINIHFEGNSCTEPAHVDVSQNNSNQQPECSRAPILPCHEEEELVEEILGDVIDHSSSSSLDDSFKSLLPTPQKEVARATKRKASINCRAIELKKSLFPKSSRTHLPKKASCTKGKISYTKENASKSCKQKHQARTHSERLPKASTSAPDQNQESWYCDLCKEDRVIDMRKCKLCKKYFHEECVGLTANDTDDFVCPFCENAG